MTTARYKNDTRSRRKRRGAVYAAVILSASFLSLPCKAEEPVSRFEGVGVGLGIQVPVLGLTVRKELNRRRALVLGVGTLAAERNPAFLLQLEQAKSIRSGRYWYIGMGGDAWFGVVRGGYGYRWPVGPLSLSIEVGLSLPFKHGDRAPENAGLGYLLPVGIGLQYYF